MSEGEESTTLQEVALRKKWADRSEQQCTCQDYTGLKQCICEEN